MAQRSRRSGPATLGASVDLSLTSCMQDADAAGRSLSVRVGRRHGGIPLPPWRPVKARPPPLPTSAQLISEGGGRPFLPGHELHHLHRRRIVAEPPAPPTKGTHKHEQHERDRRPNQPALRPPAGIVLN